MYFKGEEEKKGGGGGVSIFRTFDSLWNTADQLVTNVRIFLKKTFPLQVTMSGVRVCHFWRF